MPADPTPRRPSAPPMDSDGRRLGKPPLRPTRATIDLSAIRHNLSTVRELSGPAARVFAVVKADAYGHGMLAVAREALAWGADALAVATPDEALCLRESPGIGEAEILIVGPTMPADAAELQCAGIAVAIGNRPLMEAHLAEGRRRNAAPKMHLHLDTGMGRFGFGPAEWDGALDAMAREAGAFAGLMTHFSVSDSGVPDDVEYTGKQIQDFAAVAALVRDRGPRPIVHAANSGAIIRHPAATFDAVRPGIMLYGAQPDPVHRVPGIELRQPMTLRTQVVSIHSHAERDSISYGRKYRMPRDGRIGLLPVGYGDGLPRAYGATGQGDGGRVLIGGRRVPIVGRVCMDQTLIDLTPFPDVAVGDEVVLYGAQGPEFVSTEEVAGIVGTIPYEITCQVGRRIPREWTGASIEESHR
ncbi:MAG: alanine racemase [Sumerlaeia bacterium]